MTHFSDTIAVPYQNLLVKLDADQTNATTTLANTAIAQAMSTGEVWVVRGTLFFDATTAADIKVKLSCPGDWTGHWGGVGPATGASSISAQGSWASNPLTGSGIFGGLGAGTDSFITVSGLIRPGSDGTMTLQFAENASDATGTILRADSFLNAIQFV